MRSDYSITIYAHRENEFRESLIKSKAIFLGVKSNSLGEITFTFRCNDVTLFDLGIQFNQRCILSKLNSEAQFVYIQKGGKDE